MKRAASLAIACAPVDADVASVLSTHVLPGFAQVSQAAVTLETAARTDCSAAHVRSAFMAAFDAWMAVADLHIGPSETGALSIAFWPDDRGFTPRALSDLISAEDPIVMDGAAFADVSIAARGLFALEMLLYDPAFSRYGQDEFTCALVRAVAADLARQSIALKTAWTNDFAPKLISAGAADNPAFLSADEAVRAIYTQLLTGLEFTADARIGRPMGTIERPQPRRAEAWRSGRSLRNIGLSIQAALALAQGLSGTGLPMTEAAAERVMRAAGALADPAFQDTQDPQARLKVEILQQAVRALRAAIETEIGYALGIAPGLNSQDGD